MTCPLCRYDARDGAHGSGVCNVPLAKRLKRGRKLKPTPHNEKFCTRCQRVKPATQEYFGRVHGYTRLSSWCKECGRETARERRRKSEAMPKGKVEYKDVDNDVYPGSHEPLHPQIGGCAGCDLYRLRRNRNTRAGRVVAVNAREDTPVGACHGCGTPAFLGRSEQAEVLAWNQDLNRASWSLEERPAGALPTHCPRCRRKAA